MIIWFVHGDVFYEAINSLILFVAQFWFAISDCVGVYIKIESVRMIECECFGLC